MRTVITPLSRPVGDQGDSDRAGPAKGRHRQAKRPLEAIPRITLTKQEAADALGMSVDSFERYVQPFVKTIALSRGLVLIPVDELKRWARENARYLAGEVA